MIYHFDDVPTAEEMLWIAEGFTNRPEDWEDFWRSAPGVETIWTRPTLRGKCRFCQIPAGLDGAGFCSDYCREDFDREHGGEG